MLTPKQREQLAKLNRDIAKKHRREAGAKLTTANQMNRPNADAAGLLYTSLSDVVPGTVHRSAGGTYYLVQREVERLCADGGELDRGLRRALSGSTLAVSPDQLHEAVRPLVGARPERVLFLDIETCGFIGVPLFLVGLMGFQNGKLVMRQFLARNYAEEGPLLAAMWDTLRQTDVLVSFNGKSFDLPMILDRSSVNGIFDCPTPSAHVDLLHEARRRWGHELPNCCLQTVEQFICGRRRSGDIPSSEIPEVYHQFVRTADDGEPHIRARCLRQLQSVVHHNALDIITLGELVVHILT